MEEDGCPPPYRVIDMFTMGTRCNDPSRCSRFVVPFFVNETDVWATYVYDIEDKVAYMVDPTLTEAKLGQLMSCILRMRKIFWRVYTIACGTY